MMRTIVAGLLLLAAGAAQAQNTLNIYNWNDYVSPQALERFERETGIRVRYDVYDSLETLEGRLSAPEAVQALMEREPRPEEPQW